MTRADALILVVPEYNHGYPGLLKHALYERAMDRFLGELIWMATVLRYGRENTAPKP